MSRSLTLLKIQFEIVKSFNFFDYVRVKWIFRIELINRG